MPEKENINKPVYELLGVKAYGFIDLEGAKTSAVIAEYGVPVDASSIDMETFAVMDYVRKQLETSDYESVIEVDRDDIKGNEGAPEKIYVNDKPEPDEAGGKASGRFVIIEVNTKYMLSGQNLPFTETMMAGVTQLKDVKAVDGTVIPAGTEEVSNYVIKEVQGFGGPHGGPHGPNSGPHGPQGGPHGPNGPHGPQGGSHGPNGGPHGPNGPHGPHGPGPRGPRKKIFADKDSIILPELGEGSGWVLNHIGETAFKATHCYSEYTGQYYDFEIPYSIFIPDQEILDANKGKVALVVHMEHAGSNDSDPLAGITSSRAAVKLASKEVQSRGPAIVVVPQIEEARRSTDDFDASSEANTAVWELIDWLLEKYADYIDTNRIYGTGQSMGGMTILNMAAQRDNFFGGIAVIGAQWSNNYDKSYQHNGAPIRTPEVDPISFAIKDGEGFGHSEQWYKENFENWYYMISDDNIFVHTCIGDSMSWGEWNDTAQYFKACGVEIPYVEYDPYMDLEEQNAIDKKLTDHDNTTPGSGINWATFSRGSHMSTWKYAYALDYAFEWLFSQSRETENARGKVEQLNNKWLGRDSEGNIIEGSGTKGLNSAQYTPGGASEIYTEGWTVPEN